MRLDDDDIRNNPIYREELIRQQARIDMNERQKKIEKEAKAKKELIITIIWVIGAVIMILIVYSELIDFF